MADPMTREEIAAAEERHDHDRDHYGCRKHPAIRAECDWARALVGNRAYHDLREKIEKLNRRLLPQMLWARSNQHFANWTQEVLHEWRDIERELRALLAEQEPTE